jgi:hypothetical protein
LPSLLRRYRTPLPYLLWWVPFIAAYQISNRWPLTEPVVLPFTCLDRQIPFVPALLPVYIAYIPLYWVTVFRSEDDAQANRIFYGAYFQLALCLPFFLAFPVTMPRDLFYGSELHGLADRLWRWFDGPNNCFPSLHTSNSLLLLEFNWKRRWRMVFAPASLAGGLVYLASNRFLRRLDVARRARSKIARGARPSPELDAEGVQS